MSFYAKPRSQKNYFWPRLAMILGGLVVVALVIGIGAFSISNMTHMQTQTCTVTDKDRTTKVTDGVSSSDMRVYTSDCGTLKVADSLLDWQFDSADVYSSIEVGKTYTFETRGKRIPFMSMFPNIVGVSG